MTNPTTYTGSCLCKKVTAILTPKESSFGACHCGMCRKWTGGPSLALDCGTQVTFQADSQPSISIYDSSKWAERGFCKQCGNCLFYRLKGNKTYFFNLGFLDDIDALTFHHQIFIDDKPGSYSFSNKTENKTGAEVFAAVEQEQI